MPHWDWDMQCSITALKKAVYDEGWEATLIPALKQSIKEKACQIPFPTILCLFNMMAVCTQDSYWAVHCQASNYAPLGTNLARNIDESTYFCL